MLSGWKTSDTPHVAMLWNKLLSNVGIVPSALEEHSVKRICLDYPASATIQASCCRQTCIAS